MNLFALQNGAWRAVSRVDGSFGILFGERDTLFLTSGGVVFATATSGRLPLAPFPATAYPGGFSFAPDGSAYAFGTEYDARVVRRSGVTSVVPGTPSVYATSRTTWLPDSRSVIVSQVRILDNSGTRFETTISRLSVGSSQLTLEKQNVVASGANTGVTSISASDEGGRVVFRLSGPFFSFAEVDCSILSATSSLLDSVRTQRQFQTGVCGAVAPPGGGGGGGQEGRIFRAPPSVSLSVLGAKKNETLGNLGSKAHAP